MSDFDEDSISPRVATPGARRVRLVNNWIRPCCVEIVGTMAFVFVTTLHLVASADPAPPKFQSRDLTPAIIQGFTLTLLMIGMGHISGGHFNPAVTLAVVLSRGLKPLQGLAFFFSQILGGITGAAISRGCFGSDHWAQAIYFITKNEEQPWPAKFVLSEAALSTILVLTFLMAVHDSYGQNILGPLAVGFAMMVASAIGSGYVNPARVFGSLVVASFQLPSKKGRNMWNQHYVPWVGPIIGTLIAVAFYKLLLARNDNRAVLNTTTYSKRGRNMEYPME